MEKVIYTNDYNETINLGEKIGNLLHPGDVILLDGNVHISQLGGDN